MRLAPVLIIAAASLDAGADEGRGSVGPPPIVHEAQLFGHEDGTEGTAGDEFGWSVAVFGDTLIVGARLDDVPGAGGGSAYVFVRSGSTWTEQAKLSVPDAAGFGWSVSIDGDSVVVGGPLTLTGGVAYVFVRSGTTWTQQQKLVPSDPTSNSGFGMSVAISGDTIVIGAPQVGTGAAYVFVRSGTQWTEQQKLLASDGLPGDRLGIGVAISGDTALVGAAFDDLPSGTDAGSAYVFVRSGATWTEQQKLVAPGSVHSSNWFGAAVSLSGDTAAVGAPQESGGGPLAGSAYVYVRSGTTWSLQQKLLASDGANSDVFGSSVALAGDVLFVGAPGDDTVAGTDAGSAYLFLRSGSTWSEVQKLLAPDGAADDFFGSSAAFYGDTAVLGALWDDTPGGDNSGSAHVFRGSVPVGLQSFGVE